MKKVFFVLLIAVSASCSPYQKMREPVQMNYAITIADHGSILCRDYRIAKDTMFLLDAGYDARKTKQRNVSDIKMVGDWDYMIIPIAK